MPTPPSACSRRAFLQVGALGTSLTLAQSLRLHASEPKPATKRSAIFVFLEGGPSHQDTFDLKPKAPAEFRGEFKPIATTAPGVEICEHLPELAKRAKDFAIVRGVTHNLADHGIGKQYLLTGNRPSQVLKYPEYGCVVSKEYPSAKDVPSFVSIDESFAGPGYLGTPYSALTAGKPKAGTPYRVRGVTLDDGLTVEKYRSQTQLLTDLDTAFRGHESLDDSVRGLDRFGQQAFDMISHPTTRAAFDLSKEPATERAVRFARVRPESVTRLPFDRSGRPFRHRPTPPGRVRLRYPSAELRQTQNAPAAIRYRALGLVRPTERTRPVSFDRDLRHRGIRPYAEGQRLGRTGPLVASDVR